MWTGIAHRHDRDSPAAMIRLHWHTTAKSGLCSTPGSQQEFQSDKSYLLAAAPQSLHPGSTLIFLRSTAPAVLVVVVARCTGSVVGHDNAVEIGDLRSSPQLATTSSIPACNAPCLEMSWPVPPARKKPGQGLKWLHSMAALPTHQTPT